MSFAKSAVGMFKNPAQVLVPFVLFGALTVVFVALAVKATKWKEL
ncbi:MAG: hypothetical protein AB1476_00925 [Candidatus Hadarchaeota archaeon]